MGYLRLPRGTFGGTWGYIGVIKVLRDTSRYLRVLRGTCWYLEVLEGTCKNLGVMVGNC